MLALKSSAEEAEIEAVLKGKDLLRILVEREGREEIVRRLKWRIG